jgi:hypothetical protein
MIGRESGRRRDERKEEGRRGGSPAKLPRPVDPIFSKPYEPGSAPSQQSQAPRQEPNRGKRRQPQVAALLGGLKRG